MASNAAKPLAWLHSISPWILKIPVTFIEVAVWVFMTYYVIGFDPNFGRFIRPYVVLVAISQMTSALFRFIAAMGRNIVCCELFWLICSASSFCIDWIHFITRGCKEMVDLGVLVVNKFLGHSWNHVPANSNSAESLGIQVFSCVLH
ncbi:unnamed protein product [Linum trigynum]|uniref:ABC-2 type transporter transmembrane domain-containing protein n=1 Tax=Linum trigynum TaxID=586398 RepID=A0AAV2FFY7_9ROSI